MKLQDDKQVLSLLIADHDQQTVLVATEHGYGKRTVLADFRHSGRGTQGVKAIAISERNGLVVTAKLVNDEDEIMLITTGGVLISTRVNEIRALGRATQGVKLINLGEGEKLSGLEKIVESDDTDADMIDVDSADGQDDDSAAAETDIAAQAETDSDDQAE
jgi:DNA gyrase subunit A